MAKRLEVTMLTESLKANIVSLLREEARSLARSPFIDLRLGISQHTLPLFLD